MKENKEKVFNIVILIIYISLIISMAFVHECYIDDSQAWLIARDLNPLQIIKQMKYEGHSYLWYFLIYPLAHNNFDILFGKVYSIFFAILTAIIILKKAPFNRISKILLIFNPGMIIYYSQVTRPYCLIPFIMVCLASIYKDKEKHPFLYSCLLGILSNTHLVMMPIVVIYAIYYWVTIFKDKFKNSSKREKKNYILALIILCLFVINILVITMFGAFNCRIVSRYDSIKELIYSFLIKFVYNALEFGRFLNVDSIISAIIFAITIYSFYLIKKDIKNGIVYLLQFIFMLMIHSLFWFTIPIRAFLVIYTFMLWVWINKIEKKDNKFIKNYGILEFVLCLLLIVTYPHNYKFIIEDYTKECNLGKSTAKYIEENIENDSVFIMASNDYQQPIAVYLKPDDYKLYSVFQDDFITFNVWNNEYAGNHYLYEVYDAYKKLNSFNNIYVILPCKTFIDFDYREEKMLDKNIREFEDYMSNYINIELIYKSDTDNMIKDFTIYDQTLYYIYKCTDK